VGGEWEERGLGRGGGRGGWRLFIIVITAGLPVGVITLVALAVLKVKVIQILKYLKTRQNFGKHKPSVKSCFWYRYCVRVSRTFLKFFIVRHICCDHDQHFNIFNLCADPNMTFLDKMFFSYFTRLCSNNEKGSAALKYFSLNQCQIFLLNFFIKPKKASMSKYEPLTSKSDSSTVIATSPVFAKNLMSESLSDLSVWKSSLPAKHITEKYRIIEQIQI
jgi:hypothetical protein